MNGQWRGFQITNINFKAKIQDLDVWKWGGEIGVGSNPGRICFFLNCCKAMGFYVWVCVCVLFPRIEPVGKPYREVCLQTVLWPGKVHQPSSWSLYLSELALKLKEKKILFFFSFFFFFKWLFWGWNWTYFQHMNSKKKIKKKVGYLWDLIQGPLNLASDALPTALRGTSLQGTS